MSPVATPVSRETQDKLNVFRALLGRWGRALNLVSKNDLDQTIVSRHIFESLDLIPYFPNHIERFTDLGSGGGFPAIPIAIATGFYVDLIESDHRKAAFLETALSTLGLPGRVWPERIETCAVDRTQCITARGLSSLPLLLRYCEPLLGPNGVGLFVKGNRAEAEIEAAAAGWRFQADLIPLPSSRSRLLRVSRLERGDEPPR